MSAILLGIAAIFAYILKIYLGFDFMAAFLSFAPGGLHEVVVISVAYDIDPLFVISLIAVDMTTNAPGKAANVETYFLNLQIFIK